MRIGILLSGYEQLPLFSVLNKFDCEYEIFVDRKYRPWPEKSNDLVNERIEYGLDYLINTIEVDYCIVPALYELEYLSSDWSYKEKILPIYSSYIHSCFWWSLVWKIWLLTTPSWYKNAQALIIDASKNYEFSKKQRATRKFNNPFSLWTKSVRMRAYYITSYSKKDWMVRKSIKNDLRYFHDAWVDTIIPTSWMFLYYEKVLHHQLNWKKIKFHWIDSIEKNITSLLWSNEKEQWSYGITIHTTDESVGRLEEKKWVSLLTRWNKHTLRIKRV